MKQDKETTLQVVVSAFHTFTYLVAATIVILVAAAFITGTPTEHNTSIDYPVEDN